MKKRDDGPAVFRFKARLTRHPEAAKSRSRALLGVPEIVGKKLRGMTTIEGTINDQPFRAPLEPKTSGSCALRVNEAMLRGAGAKLGDTVSLAILGPEPKIKLPAELRTAFAASDDAQTLWADLTDLARRDWVRWIEAAKTPQTRARRVTRTIEQLASGKRRPCCVNVYEFMLRRIDESMNPS